MKSFREFVGEGFMDKIKGKLSGATKEAKKYVTDKDILQGIEDGMFDAGVVGTIIQIFKDEKDDPKKEYANAPGRAIKIKKYNSALQSAYKTKKAGRSSVISSNDSRLK